MNRYAAIDIGTNSMRLLLASVEQGNIVERRKEVNTTRIGGSVDKNKQISEEGIERNIEALGQFVEEGKAYGAEKILAIATSAVRDAANGQDFVKRAYEKTGVSIEVISGEEEAELGYQGVAMGLGSTASNRQLEERILVIDIGGGSTELILGQGKKLQKTISLNVGAVRMTERHITTDPIEQEQYTQMEADIYSIVKDTLEEIKVQLKAEKSVVPVKLMGIGGTITTLAAIHQELDPYDSDKVHNYKLTSEDVAALKQKLSMLKVEEIRNLKGIHPKRADIILAGATILTIIMGSLNSTEITVSEYDNLEGLILPFL